MPVARSETRIEREVRVEAQPEVVFAFLTDPEKMVRWMGEAAILDPRPGGVFEVRIREDMPIQGRFVEVVPYSRVVFTWGYGDPVPHGSSTVEVELMPDGKATIVHLTHRELPEDVKSFHELGWDHYLPRLVTAAAGEDPGPDPMAEIANLDT